MGVMATAESVERFCKRAAKGKGNLYDMQRKMLCGTEDHPFTDLKEKDIQRLLHFYGLFKPESYKKAERFVKDWKEQDVYYHLEKEYERLKKMWQGPDVPVYLYPFQGNGGLFGRGKGGKGGAAFADAVYIFYGEPEEKDDWKAVLAHEYNHVCRIHRGKRSLKEVSLLESLIIEGLGEYAVHQLYGEKYTAAWTQRYSDRHLEQIWKKKYLHAIHIKGQEKHMDYLYGNRKQGFPKWAGYQLGYRMVESYHRSHPEETIRTLLQKSAEDIYHGSLFFGK
ncbi:DUF2268 domain-containing protein [Halobacillus litoralis]|uniref:DUF2268 domain-containing protein n=1 Tax=Halobacillus litoralis TaxID=45668 RepID=UPI00136A1781|nr:DUF2268 domain-containing putative Zn-dependent protease [Halobacillus litoralis]MYL36983.1 hypothetical protein [Halobacillus litoralis]